MRLLLGDRMKANQIALLFGQANQPVRALDIGAGGFSESANKRRLQLQIRINFWEGRTHQ